MATAVPIVYSLRTCQACRMLRQDWTREGVAFEERIVDDNQQLLDEALKYADIVPIIIHPDGRVEVGYKHYIS
jgi:glutaredoxin